MKQIQQLELSLTARKLGEAFADGFLKILRAEGFLPRPEKLARKRRRSDELSEVEDQIVAYLESRPNSYPVAIGTIAKGLCVEPKALFHPLQRLFKKRRLLRRGDRNKAVYRLNPKT